MIGLLFFTALEFPSCGKRRININQAHARGAVGVDQFPTLFHLQQRFHGLQVVAEDEHVVPVCSVASKGADGLQRHGHCFGNDIFFALLARVYQFVLLALQREEQVLVFDGQVFAVFEQGEDVLALVFG